jgi:uncharacterized BrkB/YihY/UPF0761 family membrane protein
MAAAVAYYAALSLFPLTLLLISVLGFVLRFSSGAQNARQELLELVAENASPVLAQHVGEVFGQISDNAMFGGPVALIALLLAAVGVFAQVERGFGRIWRSPQASPRGVLAVIREAFIYRLRAFLMLLSAGLVVLAALASGIATSIFHKFTMKMPGGDWVWARLEVFAGEGPLVGRRPGRHRGCPALGGRPANTHILSRRQELHRLWRCGVADRRDALDIHRRQRVVSGGGVFQGEQ